VSEDGVPVGTAGRRQPVIIGSGLSGLMVSRALSRAGIRHTLLGGPPNDLPRLGESLNLEGTLGLLESFPDLAPYYFTKKLVVGYVGDYVLTCDFNLADQPRTRRLLGLLGYRAPQGFLHLERVGMDAALYRQAVAEPSCEVRDGRVEDLTYDPAEDRITHLRLADGAVLEPSFVYDATNHGRLVARAVGLGFEPLSRPQHTVYTHYHLGPRGAEMAQEPWEHASNLVRLFAEPDGLDALSWCIPLGDYVSIGVSVDAERDSPPDDELLALAEKAYAARGLHYRRRFGEPSTTMALTHTFFAHERGYGANWLLVGPSACQIWWMSGSGVGSGYAASEVAVKVLRDPMGVGRWYSDYVRMMLRTHRVFDWFALVDRAAVTAESLSEHADGFILGNVMRLAKSYRTRQGPATLLVGDATFYLAERRLVARHYCPVIGADMADQTDAIFAATAAGPQPPAPANRLSD
jgi:flavin-dependent dehydrogenase